jgi:hypothetical protein
MVRRLQDNGASVDSSGRTTSEALDRAMAGGHAAVADLLRQTRQAMRPIFLAAGDAHCAKFGASVQ